MYSYGEEFVYNIEGNLEYFTALGTVKLRETEYIVAENEYGLKKAFKVDEDEEEIILLPEDEEEVILDIFYKQMYDDEPDFGEIDDDYEYEVRYIEGRNNDDDDDFDEFIDDTVVEKDFDYDEEFDGDEDDLDDFINDLLDDEEFYD